MPRMAWANPGRCARFQGYHNTGKGRGTLSIYTTKVSHLTGRAINKFSFRNSRYIYIHIYPQLCTELQGGSSCLLHAKKPVLQGGGVTLQFPIRLNRTKCGQRIPGKPLSSLAVLQCGRSATKKRQCHFVGGLVTLRWSEAFIPALVTHKSLSVISWNGPWALRGTVG